MKGLPIPAEDTASQGPEPEREASLRDKDDRGIAFVIEKETGIEITGGPQSAQAPAEDAGCEEAAEPPKGDGPAPLLNSEHISTPVDPRISEILEFTAENAPDLGVADAGAPEESAAPLASEAASSTEIDHAEIPAEILSEMACPVVESVNETSGVGAHCVPSVESILPLSADELHRAASSLIEETVRLQIADAAAVLEPVAGLAGSPVQEAHVEAVPIDELIPALEAAAPEPDDVKRDPEPQCIAVPAAELNVVVIDDGLPVPARSVGLEIERENEEEARSPREAGVPIMRATVPLSGMDLWRAYAKQGGRYAACAIGGYLAVVVLLIFVYRFVDPPASTLMVFQAFTGRDIDQRWTDLEDVSPNLVRAVVVSEDGTFCSHWGIDFAAMGQAIENAVDGIPRGASTISMQVTKNLFLWQSKSYIRKAIELPLTLLMELIWPKRRILEVYLNIAEWAPGIFGAEAAAQFHFNKPAGSLSEREAALLAASLPNPMVRDAGDPGPRTARKASLVQARMRAGGGDAARCIFNTK